jgi:hypothetical protein
MSDTFRPINGGVDWFKNIGPDSDIDGCCSCNTWWPNGWGGDATDSTHGGTYVSWDEIAANTSGTQIDYGFPTYSAADMCGVKVFTVDDAATLIVTAEAPRIDAWSASQISFPNTCRHEIPDYWLERDGQYDDTCANNDHPEG